MEKNTKRRKWKIQKLQERSWRIIIAMCFHILYQFKENRDKYSLAPNSCKEKITDYIQNIDLFFEPVSLSYIPIISWEELGYILMTIVDIIYVYNYNVSAML